MVKRIVRCEIVFFGLFILMVCARPARWLDHFRSESGITIVRLKDAPVRSERLPRGFFEVQSALVDESRNSGAKVQCTSAAWQSRKFHVKTEISTRNLAGEELTCYLDVGDSANLATEVQIILDSLTINGEKADSLSAIVSSRGTARFWCMKIAVPEEDSKISLEYDIKTAVLKFGYNRIWVDTCVVDLRGCSEEGETTLQIDVGDITLLYILFAIGLALLIAILRKIDG